MDREQSPILILCALAFLVIGAILGGLLVDEGVERHGDWGRRSLYLMRFSTLMFIWLLYRKISGSYPRIRRWATDTFGGVSIILFGIGFAVVLLPNSYMHIQLTGWLHFSIAVILSLVAAGFGFFLLASKNS